MKIFWVRQAIITIGSLIILGVYFFIEYRKLAKLYAPKITVVKSDSLIILLPNTTDSSSIIYWTEFEGKLYPFKSPTMIGYNTFSGIATGTQNIMIGEKEISNSK